jgi:hypothetical protein
MTRVRIPARQVPTGYLKISHKLDWLIDGPIAVSERKFDKQIVRYETGSNYPFGKLVFYTSF